MHRWMRLIRATITVAYQIGGAVAVSAVLQLHSVDAVICVALTT